MTTEQEIQDLTRQYLPKIQAAFFAENGDAVHFAQETFLKAISDVLGKMRVERPVCPLPLSDWPIWANYAAQSFTGYWHYFESKPELTNSGLWWAQKNTASQCTDVVGHNLESYKFSLYHRDEVASIEIARSLINQVK